MADELTFDDYINNPTGAKSRVVGEKEYARQIYNKKYDNMILLCANKIEYYLFKKENDRFLIYIKMPSETQQGLTYDVVLDFTTKDDVVKRKQTLKDYNIRFFSNDPNFIFTYAYAFNKKQLLVPEVKKKISNKALETPPTKTNPYEMAGYIKTIYFSYIFMTLRGLFNKSLWLQASPINQAKGFLQNNIMQSDEKLLFAQNFKRLTANEKKLGKPMPISRSDPKGVEKAAKNTEHAVKFARTVDKINRENKRRNNHYVHVVGK